MTLHARIAQARQRLVEAGLREIEAGLDARLLAQHVLGWDAARIVSATTEAEPADFPDLYDALVTRRVLREPFAYIVGHREFWGLEFELSPAVLIPRPETELVVESLLEIRKDRSAPLRIADVGTGSGVLAVAVAREFPNAQVTATDISPEALAFARRNAVRHHVADRIQFVATDLLAGVKGPFDVIVSNPPYVRDTDRPALTPEVGVWEPSVALFGGNTGLAIVERLLDEAAEGQLAPGGDLFFEFGAGQVHGVEQLISRCSGLTMVGLRADLQGIERVAILKR